MHLHTLDGVPADFCLPRGLEIYKGIGGQLKSSIGASLEILADDVPRNIDSAHALATGLGLDPWAVVVNPAPFLHCDAVSAQTTTDTASARGGVGCPSRGSMWINVGIWQ